jgi:hypothetical protein
MSGATERLMHTSCVFLLGSYCQRAITCAPEKKPESNLHSNFYNDSSSIQMPAKNSLVAKMMLKKTIRKR